MYIPVVVGVVVVVVVVGKGCAVPMHGITNEFSG